MSRSSFEENKRWSDRFLNEIKSILGLHLISVAPFDEDAKRNTDLMVLAVDGIRVGCRVRRYEQIKYQGEFTLRCKLPSGQKTELEKIINGNLGQYFFYGFSCETGKNLLQWRLADLGVFRDWFRDFYFQRGIHPGELKKNTDGTMFRVYKWEDMPDNFVIAHGNRENTIWLLDLVLRSEKIDTENQLLRGNYERHSII